MRKLPERKLPKEERARQLPPRLITLIEDFDQAAQIQGWQADQGYEEVAIKRAFLNYERTKKNLINYLVQRIS